MKFHHISLRVKDFEKSLRFYTELVQLKIGKQFSTVGGNVAYLYNSEGDTEIELIAMPEGQQFEGKGFPVCQSLRCSQGLWHQVTGILDKKPACSHRQVFPL